MITITLFLFAAVFGSLIGSFLNVCISRLPEGLSIVKPRSRCPKCLTPISFYDNVPLLSFIFLRGRCRHCSLPIPWRYPAVEILTGVATALLFLKWRAEPAWLAAALCAAYLLIVIAFIDLETMMIADIFSYGLLCLGLASCFFNPYFSGPALSRFLGFLAGGASGAFIVWLMAWLGARIYKKEAVGEGDIFLMSGIGALTGWQGVISALIMASFFGSVYGITLLLAKKAKRFDHIPFGPFLALGALINLYRLIRPADLFFYW
ncbi:MAG: prepilin peptidase [Elusimicrobiales bacterium]|jgi:leader peptidase (prepilin peptidase)/N-methyltransferase